MNAMNWPHSTDGNNSQSDFVRIEKRKVFFILYYFMFSSFSVVAVSLIGMSIVTPLLHFFTTFMTCMYIHYRLLEFRSEDSQSNDEIKPLESIIVSASQKREEELQQARQKDDEAHRKAQKEMQDFENRQNKKEMLNQSRRSAIMVEYDTEDTSHPLM